MTSKMSLGSPNLLHRTLQVVHCRPNFIGFTLESDKLQAQKDQNKHTDKHCDVTGQVHAWKLDMESQLASSRWNEHL